MAFFAAPPFLRYLDTAKLDTAKIQIQSLGAALDLYAYEIGAYPSGDEGLKALVERPAAAARWNGPYLKRQEMLLDPWGRPYHYRMPGQHGAYDLYSLGPKGAEGAEDSTKELRSW